MKILQLCFVAAVAISLNSCLEPEPIDEEFTLTDSNSSTDTEPSSQTEATSSDNSEAAQAPSIIGLWTSTGIAIEGSVTTTNSAVGGPPETMQVSGNAININHEVSFLDVPSIALGEGIYTMHYEELENGESTEYDVAGLSLITSQTNWSLSGDQLTLDSGGKIRVAFVTELTDDTLILQFEEYSQTESADGTITVESYMTTIFEFVKN